MVEVLGIRLSGMYIMPTRRCGSDSKEPKDILERMQLQILMTKTLGAICTIIPDGFRSLPCLSSNNMRRLPLE